MSDYGFLLEQAMKIHDQADADQMLGLLVDKCMAEDPTKSREESLRIQRCNLGYFAGYYDNETRARVERLFACEHPIFGAIAEKGSPTAQEAFQAGVDAGRQTEPIVRAVRKKRLGF